MTTNRNGTMTGNPDGPRLLTLKEGSSYSGLTLWAMRERIWNGEIPVVTWKDGKKQFVDRRDLDKFIEDNKRYAV